MKGLSESIGDVEVTDETGSHIPMDEGMVIASKFLFNARDRDGKVMLVGNGGSAAMVSHIQADLEEGSKIRAMVFTEGPVLTARSNDHGYETAFERPVGLWGKPRDVLIAISSSGNSENIVRAVERANHLGCKTITFTGFTPMNAVRQLGHLNFYVPSWEYGTVETAHAILTHFLTDQVKVQK